MKVLTVDLYEYFNLDREGNIGGNLTCILHENSVEISSQRLYPAMLVLPGGGYHFCSDREAEPIAEQYFSRGFNTFILRYSCKPSRYPTQLIEAAMAMAFIKRKAKEHFTDKNHVAVIGFSAGGHLCGNIATSFTLPEISKKTGVLPEEARPDCAVLSYAVISPEKGASGGTFDNLSDGNKTILNDVSIDKLVNKNTPPMFIWHTSNDACVDVSNAFVVAESAYKHGVPFELHVFENGQHGLSVADASVYRADNMPQMSTGVEKWIDMSVNFMRAHGFGFVD